MWGVFVDVLGVRGGEVRTRGVGTPTIVKSEIEGL